MKELYQDICRETFTWDEILPEKVQNRWQEVLTLFKKIKEIKISRQYLLKSVSKPAIAVELHCFSDANKRNYASVIYLYFIYRSGNIKVSIIAAKSQLLTVTNSMTIPRPELNGLLLMCEFVPSVVNALKTNYEFHDIYFWADSSIAYSWVKNEHKIHKPYVQRRSNKIKDVIKEFETFS